MEAPLSADQQALCVQYLPLASRLARRYGKGIDKEEAFGVAQLALVKGVAIYADEATEQRLFCTIRRGLDAWRKKELRLRRSGLAGGMPPFEPIAPECEPLDDPDTTFWSQLLRHIPQEYRETARLAWIERLGQAKIAERLGVHQTVISDRLIAAREAAAQYFGIADAKDTSNDLVAA